MTKESGEHMTEETIKIRLKGHETFILREGWLTKGINAVDQNHAVFSENYGADALGVGTNMAKAIRYWLRESNLIEEQPRQGVKLSGLGRIILEYDPYLEDDFALWIVHSNLASKLHTVTSWYLFFHTLEAEEFRKEELPELMRREITAVTGNRELSQRSLNDDCNAILNMYSRNHTDHDDPEDKSISPFAKFGLIKRDGSKYCKCQPNLSLLHEFVVLYLLQKYFGREESVTIGDLLEKSCTPGKLLNLKRAALSEYLDILENREYIRINRTAGLDMVYRNCDWTPEEVVEHYYKIFRGKDECTD